MDLFIVLITFSLVIIALITILNALTFPRLSEPSSFFLLPSISVLVPARNESSVIAATVKSWLAQTYPNFELLILDDHSCDGTADLARQAADSDPRVQVLSGAALPEGWTGKNWACHQLSQAARGDILLFTDADVCWETGALTALIAEMTCSRADLLTVWPTQITNTWAERLVVPLMGFVIIGYLPVLAVHYIPLAVFAAAMGQCLVFRRDVYDAIGGHDTIRNALVEDMAFAQSIKRLRLRLRAADGAGLVSTRMYRGWPEVRDGFAKNILGGHGESLIFLALSAIFHWSLFLLPWVWLFFDPVQAALLCTLGLLIRLLTAAVTRQRLVDGLLMPVSVLLMTVIAGRAVQWHFSGGPRWKGRAYER